MKERHYKTLFTTVLDYSDENIKAYKEDIAEQKECNVEDVSDETVFNWMREDNDADWDNFQYELECYDRKHPNALYEVAGSLGLWNGRHTINPCEISSLEEAIRLCLGNDSMFDFTVKEDQFGAMVVEYCHHDGCNIFYIKKKEPNLKNVRFRKELGYI